MNIFKISDDAYQVLVKIQRFLPVLGAAYLAIAKVWGLPFGDQINQTITILASLLAAYIEIAIATYEKDGTKNGSNQITNNL